MPDARSKGGKAAPPSDDGLARVTLADVARIAGVSLATASRALGAGPRVPRAELTARVRKVADELHFIPNPAAQAVARGRAAIVGLILHDINDPYFATIASVVLEAAESEGLMAVIADARRDPQRELRYMTSFRHQRVRAIIIAGSRSGNEDSRAALQRQIHLFIEEGGRIALISQPELDANTVSVRNREASEALAGALCGRGYRDFAVFAGPATLRTSTDRVEGFRTGLRTAGFELRGDRVYRADLSRDGGFESAVTMMNEGRLPECIFAVNDVMALGAMAAFRAAGLEVPGDVAIAGFDDVATLRDIVPALTTVHIPVEQVAAEAVDMVLRAEEDRSLRRTVDGSVMLRESTPVREVPGIR